jgi:hypothetical protein
MEDQNRFGPEFVAAHRAIHGKRTPEQRQLTYDIAVEPAFEDWRRWYDQQLAWLPPSQADSLAGRLWLDEHFWPVTFELAAGAAIRSAGYTAVYEHDYGGSTPDCTALTSNGKPAFFLEVHTDQPSKETFGRIRAWKALERRIAKIPVGVVLMLRANKPLAPTPPNAGTAKKIARELRSWLLGSPGTRLIHTHGYTFVVHDVPSANGLYAQFAAPSGVAGPIDASRLARAVDAKVNKYVDLAEDHSVPLVVAVGAHRFTGVDLSHIDELLAGAPTVSFQFNIGDGYIGMKGTRLDRPTQWTMPADLAGLLWLDNRYPFGGAARPNPKGRRALPHPLAELVDDHRR